MDTRSRIQRTRTLSHGGSCNTITDYYAGAKFDTIPTLSILPQPPMHWKSSLSKSTPSSPIPTTLNASDKVSFHTSTYSNGRNTAPVFKSASLPTATNGLKPEITKQRLPNSGNGNYGRTNNPKQVYTVGKEITKDKVIFCAEPKVNGHDLMKMLQLQPMKKPNSNSDKPVVLATNSPSHAISSEVPSLITLEALESLLKHQLISPSGTKYQNQPSNDSPKPCHFYEANGNQYKDISEHLKSLLKVCN